MVPQAASNQNSDITVYTIKDIQRILGIGKNNAYKLLKLPTFPVIRIGKRYIIPKNEFDTWVYNSIHKKLL